jgi:hypothetical protein
MSQLSRRRWREMSLALLVAVLASIACASAASNYEPGAPSLPAPTATPTFRATAVDVTTQLARAKELTLRDRKQVDDDSFACDRTGTIAVPATVTCTFTTNRREWVYQFLMDFGADGYWVPDFVAVSTTLVGINVDRVLEDIRADWAAHGFSGVTSMSCERQGRIAVSDAPIRLSCSWADASGPGTLTVTLDRSGWKSGDVARAGGGGNGNRCGNEYLIVNYRSGVVKIVVDKHWEAVDHITIQPIGVGDHTVEFTWVALDGNNRVVGYHTTTETVQVRSCGGAKI